MQPAVEAKQLTKSYVLKKRQPGLVGAVKGLFITEKIEVEAVKSVDLCLMPGEIVGFLGPNGAGKTTVIKMLSGILYPTSGEATVLGFRPTDRNHEMLKRIALVMGNKMQLWWDLSARDGFDVLKEVYEIPADKYASRLKALSDILEIQDKLDVQVRKLSLGERMKCELVAALLHQPEVVFLDEPTLGLDVVSQKRVREFLREMNKQEGTTILLTSHYMQDVEELCNRVVVVDVGSILFDGELKALSNRFSQSKQVRLQFGDVVEREKLELIGTVLEHDGLTATIEISKEQTPMMAARLLQDFNVIDIGIEELSLEEVIRRLFRESADSNVSRET